MNAFNKKKKPKHTIKPKWEETWCTYILINKSTKSRLRYLKRGYYWETQKLKRYCWKILIVQNKYKKIRRKNDKKRVN